MVWSRCQCACIAAILPSIVPSKSHIILSKGQTTADTSIHWRRRTRTSRVADVLSMSMFVPCLGSGEHFVRRILPRFRFPLVSILVSQNPQSSQVANAKTTPDLGISIHPSPVFSVRCGVGNSALICRPCLIPSASEILETILPLRSELLIVPSSSAL